MLSLWSTVSLQWFCAYIYLYLSFMENILFPGYFLISEEFAAHYLWKYCPSSILSSRVSTPFSVSLNLLFILSISFLFYPFGIEFSDILFSSPVLSSAVSSAVNQHSFKFDQLYFSLFDFKNVNLKFHFVYPGNFRYTNIVYIAILYFVSENSNICNLLEGMSKFTILLALIQVSLLSLICLVIFHSILIVYF